MIRNSRIRRVVCAICVVVPATLVVRSPLEVGADPAPVTTPATVLPSPSPTVGVFSSSLTPAPSPGTALREEETASLLALQTSILGMIRGAGLGNSEWGVLAVSLERGDTLVAFGAHTPLAPASNQKLFTTAAAFDYLGAEYRFPTYLITRGEVRNGVLEGDLILVGTGDPAISNRMLPSATHPFEKFAAALASAGIHTVTGDVIGDGSHFEGPTRRDAWNRADLDEWYAAPVSALTFNENVVSLRIVPGAPGESPKVLTIPEGADLPILNNAVTTPGGGRGTISISRPDPDGPIEIRGEIRAQGADVWRELTVSNPPAYAASVLRTVLLQEGIRVEGGSRSATPGEGYSEGSGTTIAPAFRRGESERAKVLAVHYSPPLSEIAAVVNKKSHNLYAELLLFALGKVRFGEGSFAGGNRSLSEYLVRTVGVPAEELHVDDGSGLSRLNRASPSAFVALLSFIAATPFAETYWNTLPEAGLRQELNRMHQSAAAGNLRAKTGTISRVSALSGVVRTAQGEPILFSILSNQVPTSSAKRVEDRIGIQLASTFR